MVNMEKNGSDEIIIDLALVFRALRKKLWLILTVAVLCCALVLTMVFFFVEPRYQSTVSFYVNNYAHSSGNDSSSISSGDLTASKNLVDSYIVILRSRTTLDEVITYAGVNRTPAQVRGMISADSVNSTEFFEVVVTSTDPSEAAKIADAVTHVLPQRIASIIDGTSAKVMDNAQIPTKPSSPNYTESALWGFLGGLLLCAVVVVLWEVLDVTVRTVEDIERSCAFPVLAAVPNVNSTSEGGYYTPSALKKKNKDALFAKDNRQNPTEISFAASEAYKLLRTKLLFSFADENACHVIGMSSALAGEGKSLTAINLASTLAQMNMRVLLIDCDLRRPTVASKLRIQKIPGLTNHLTRQVSLEEIVQTYSVDEEASIHVITSGRNPPNPMEMLSSDKMGRVLDNLKSNYDYIILDLPPVDEVSDAMAVSKFTDGILLVVRQDYCDRNALNAAAREFKFVDANVLGVIYNCAEDSGTGYGKKYYKKYGAYYTEAARKQKAAQDHIANVRKEREEQ